MDGFTRNSGKLSHLSERNRTMTTRGFRQRVQRTVALIVGIALVATMLFAPVVQAAEPTQQTPDGSPPTTSEALQPGAVSADDGGAWEVGIHGTAGNLTAATAAERTGMWYWLNGWFTRRYSYAENLSWETDFKRAALGGSENSYIDSVDLQFYVGHGAPGVFTFDNAAHTDDRINSSNDCDTSWGDGDNEWFALTSCQVLSGDGLGRMAQCMNRQHLILGFVTNASAHNNYWDTQAYHFGRYLRYGYNMTQSWFNACDVAQRGRTARVIAEETACFSDNPYYSSVCADVLDSDYYWYTHNCGSETASTIPVEQLGGQMPIFKVDPYGLADAAADFTNLGEIFQVPVTATLQAAGLNEDTPPPAVPGDSAFLVSSNMSKTLQMDKDSGLYQYSDLGALWNAQQAESAFAVNAAAANYINSNVAITIANTFLTNNGLMEPDSHFYEVVADSVGTLAKGDVSAASVTEAETPSNWQVIYTRKLTATVVSAAGVAQDLEFVVVGPGAKQKVYVPLVADVSAASILDTAPIGVQGGWRSVSPAVNAATGEQVMATIINTDTAKALYLAMDSEVTMNSVPLNIINREILATTVAYWENVPGASQGELVPVYELKVKFTEKTTNAITEDFVYLPASTAYMRPLARILNAPTTAIDGGKEITLNAADAKKTLKANGIGDFDFVMGYLGKDGTYTYEWYLGAPTPANKIQGCSGLTCTFVAPYNQSDRANSFQVNLAVTDTDSANQSVATAVAEITVNPALFLPVISR